MTNKLAQAAQNLQVFFGYRNNEEIHKGWPLVPFDVVAVQGKMVGRRDALRSDTTGLNTEFVIGYPSGQELCPPVWH